MKTLLLILAAITLLSGGWSREAVASSESKSSVRIEKNRIVFPNGRTVEYFSRKYLHKTPDEALKANEAYSFTETPFVITAWRRVVVIKVSDYFEGGTRELRVYDYEANLLSRPVTVLANSSGAKDNVFFMETTKRILLGQTSSHFTVKESLLLDVDGATVKSIAQPEYTVGFGTSTDDHLFWIISVDTEIISTQELTKRPVGQIGLYSTERGELVRSTKFYKSEVVRLDYQGKVYSIKVPEPEIP